ncbi:MAG: beta-N-acetylglucosaminidase domain-containing protein, partial [Mycobacteriales bacterium]
DHLALIAKLRQLYDLGVRSLGVYWDDVAPGGAELGLAHGLGVAAAAAGLPADVRWMTCGTDYATAVVTPYLAAFAAHLPPGVPIAWTGPDITSPKIPAQVARELTDALGHPLLLCDNWPVNDLGCASQLHLGPAPARDPDLRDAVAGIGFNAMGLPLASRSALELGLRHWNNPEEDRELAWREVVAGVPGLSPIARACRSWVDEPGPDSELLSWVAPALTGDDRLLDHLDAGCRSELSPELAAELEPWLASWEAEAWVMTWVLRTLRGETPEGDLQLSSDWLGLHHRPAQVFGTRLALYGRSFRLAHRLLPHPEGIVRGENLTDLLIRQSLEGLLTQAE